MWICAGTESAPPLFFLGSQGREYGVRSYTLLPEQTRTCTRTECVRGNIGRLQPCRRGHSRRPGGWDGGMLLAVVLQHRMHLQFARKPTTPRPDASPAQPAMECSPRVIYKETPRIGLLKLRSHPGRSETHHGQSRPQRLRRGLLRGFIAATARRRRICNLVPTHPSPSEPPSRPPPAFQKNDRPAGWTGALAPNPILPPCSRRRADQGADGAAFRRPGLISRPVAFGWGPVERGISFEMR